MNDPHPKEPQHLYAHESSCSTEHSASDILLKIADNLPELIFEYEYRPHGFSQFTFLSRALHDIFEVSPAEATANADILWHRIYIKDFGKFRKAAAQSFTNDEPLQWQGRIVTAKTYRLKWIKLSARPKTGAGGVVKWDGMVSDITHLKVVERELDLARRKAEHEARARENFLATLTHEIRTPLSGIVGMTELMMMDAGQYQREQLNLLQFSAHNLMALVNNVLDFSKLNSGKVEVSESKIILRTLLENLRKVHDYRARENRTELTFDIDSSIPDLVLTDEMILMQILNNLIGNAIKFTTDGVVRLVMKQQRMLGHFMYVRIAVEDTGIGIPGDELKKIFKEFEQASGTVNQQGGTGLGLPICQKLVQMLGSELQVESKPAKGSRFHFVIRFRLAETHHIEEEKTKPSSLEHPVNLLIVDDQNENRVMLRKFFDRWEHILADEAVNGREALEKVQNNNYDLVLMDLRMPEMDGWEACRQIKNLACSKSQVPVIALTADNFSAKDKSFFDDVLLKPFAPFDLLDMIIKHTDQNPTSASMA